MIRFLIAISACAVAVFSTSCGCCTSDAAAPPLRFMPAFKEIPTTPVQVEPTK